MYFQQKKGHKKFGLQKPGGLQPPGFYALFDFLFGTTLKIEKTPSFAGGLCYNNTNIRKKRIVQQRHNANGTDKMKILSQRSAGGLPARSQDVYPTPYNTPGRPTYSPNGKIDGKGRSAYEAGRPSGAPPGKGNG